MTRCKPSLPAKKKRPPDKAASALLISVVALAPSIEVQRTMPIGLTNAALDGPARPAAVPGSTAATVIVVIAVMVYQSAAAGAVVPIAIAPTSPNAAAIVC